MNRSYRLAFALLLLTVCVVFWRYLFTPGVLFYRDITFATFPRLVELRGIVHSGAFPLWNPFEHFGEPVAANPHYLLFYPTTWLAWILPVAVALKLHFVLHFLLLASGGFLLARRAGCSPLACYFGGAFFVLSGPVMSLGNLNNGIAAAAWMPFVLLAADRLMSNPKCSAAAVPFAAAMAMQCLAGDPGTALISLCLALLLCVVVYGRAAGFRGYARFALGACLGAGLAAVQLLPAWWHAHYAVGPRPPNTAGLFWSLHPLRLMEMLVPRAWGDQFAHFRLPWLYLEGREPFLLSVFVGVVPLALALFALPPLGRATENGDKTYTRRNVFWAIIGTACLMVALGGHTPLGRLFGYARLFGASGLIRAPELFMVPVALAIAQLGAAGLDRLAIWRMAPESRFGAALLAAMEGLLVLSAAAWLALSGFFLLLPGAARNATAAFSRVVFTPAFVQRFGAVLAMDHAEAVERAALWLRESIPARLPYVLLATLVMAAVFHLARRHDLADGAKIGNQSTLFVLAVFAAGSTVIQGAANHYGLNPLVDARYFSDRSPVAALPASEAPLRVFAEPPGRRLPPLGVFTQDLDFLPPAAQFNYAQRLSLLQSAGSSGVETTFTEDPQLLLEAPHAEMQRLVWMVGQYPAIARLLAVGSVDYALLPDHVGNAVPGFQQSGVFSAFTQYPVRAFRPVEAVPRAYLVAARAAEIWPTGKATFERLLTPGFDLRRQVVLERPGFGQVESQSGTRSLSDIAGDARIEHRSATRVAVTTTSPDPTYLVLTDSYSPDWRVTVDGKPAELLRANQMFRAVAVQPGTHRVVFAYRPAPVYYGALLTVLSALAAAMLAVGRINRPRSQAASAA